MFFFFCREKPRHERKEKKSRNAKSITCAFRWANYDDGGPKWEGEVEFLRINSGRHEGGIP